MTAETIIEEIKKLSPEEVDKVSDYLIDAEHDREAHRRDREMETGSVESISEEEGLRRLKSLYS